MFTADELEALVLGARWVEGRQDGTLSRAAGLALAKIAAASPDELRAADRRGGAVAGEQPLAREQCAAAGDGARGDAAEKTLHIDYADEKGAATERAIWPAALAYFEDRADHRGVVPAAAGFPQFPHRPDRRGADRRRRVSDGGARCSWPTGGAATGMTKPPDMICQGVG